MEDWGQGRLCTFSQSCRANQLLASLLTAASWVLFVGPCMVGWGVPNGLTSARADTGQLMGRAHGLVLEIHMSVAMSPIPFSLFLTAPP